MSSHPRRLLTPGASRKRKEMEPFYAVKPPATPAPPSPQPFPAASDLPASAPAPKGAEPMPSNRLLAGYLAHEYLTKGTLFGQKWDPARAEAMPLASAHAADSRKPIRPGQIQSQSQGQGLGSEPEPSPRGVAAVGKAKAHQSYPEVASLLKSDGAHVQGIVNPAQLARWIQM